MEFISIATPAGTLPGCNSILDPRTGGIASLNRRLMAGNPPGCRIARAENTWRLLVCPFERQNLACTRHEGDKPLRSLTPMARDFRAARANGASEPQTDKR